MQCTQTCLEWLAYNSLIPLLPIPLVILGCWAISVSIPWLLLICDGQLCFYCTTLAAATIADLVKTIQKGGQGITEEQLAKASANEGIALLGLVICIILATYAYGIAVTTQAAATGSRNNWKVGLVAVFASATTTLIVVFARNSVGLFG